MIYTLLDHNEFRDFIENLYTKFFFTWFSVRQGQIIIQKYWLLISSYDW